MTEEFITAQQMRALEMAAIESGRVDGLTLMERAGQGVVDAICSHWPHLDLAQGHAFVLCGPGNNGGDGFVVARLLRDLGMSVSVFFYGNSGKLPPDAKSNYAAWVQAAPGHIEELSFPTVTATEVLRFKTLLCEKSGPVLIIDALFGIGLSRELDGLQPLLQVCAQPLGVQEPDLFRVSIDLPSGLFESAPPTSVRSMVFCADLTVTFHQRKQAHRHCRGFCGHLIVKDIGL